MTSGSFSFPGDTRGSGRAANNDAVAIFYTLKCIRSGHTLVGGARDMPAQILTGTALAINIRGIRSAE